jgi:hypothetical protein
LITKKIYKNNAYCFFSSSEKWLKTKQNIQVKEEAQIKSKMSYPIKAIE